MQNQVLSIKFASSAVESDPLYKKNKNLRWWITTRDSTEVCHEITLKVPTKDNRGNYEVKDDSPLVPVHQAILKYAFDVPALQQMLGMGEVRTC